MEEVFPVARGGRLPAAVKVTGIRPEVYAALAALLVVTGSVALLPLWISIFRMWTTDPLRSVGAVFPALALAGVLWRWRERAWAAEGTLWGLALVVVAIPLSRVVSVANLNVSVDGGLWGLMHLGPALFLYAVGATLLFGGPALLRAAIAPLCLLLAINPVPHAFNQLADMPLQELSAMTARGFAHAIGLQPTGEQLQMMFAPNFGMLIVPGCNGVRGSITLGYLTLIFAYTRRLRGWLLAGVALGALLLGYVLNLLRLCLLVVYYRMGLSLPSIQKHGEGVDYAIGCTLFLLATVGIGLAVRALAPRETAAPPESGRPEAGADRGALVRAMGFAAVALVFVIPQLHAFVTMPPAAANEAELVRLFPAQVGAFRLQGTRSEHDGNGGVVLVMADYEAPPMQAGAAAREISFGLWVGSGDHLVAFSRMVQGVRAEWTGAFDAASRSGLPVHFASAMYDDGANGSLDAEATCTAAGCSAQVAGSGRHGFLFIGPRLRDMLLPPTTLRLPIVLERTWSESDSAAGLAGAPSATSVRTQFEEDATLFTQQLDVQSLVQQAGSRP